MNFFDDPHGGPLRTTVTLHLSRKAEGLKQWVMNYHCSGTEGKPYLVTVASLQLFWANFACQQTAVGALLTLLVKTLNWYHTKNEAPGSGLTQFVVEAYLLECLPFFFFLVITVTYLSELNLFRFLWHGSFETTKSGANKILYITIPWKVALRGGHP